MSERKNIYIKPHREEHPRFYKHLWSSVKRLVNWIGHERLPEFARVALSVAQSAGHVSMQSAPYPVPAEGCGANQVRLPRPSRSGFTEANTWMRRRFDAAEKETMR